METNMPPGTGTPFLSAIRAHRFDGLYSVLLGISAAPAEDDAEPPFPWDEGAVILREGGFVYPGQCRKTKKEYAIRTITPVGYDGWKDIGRKDGACTRRRELASNGLTHVQQHFENTVVVGERGFGIVHLGRCKKTKRLAQSTPSNQKQNGLRNQYHQAGRL